MPRISTHHLDGFGIKIECEPQAYLDTALEMTLILESDVRVDDVAIESYRVTFPEALRIHVAAMLGADLEHPAVRELADQIAAAQELTDDVSAAALGDQLQADEEAGPGNDSVAVQIPPNSPPDDEVRNATPRCRACGARDGEPCRNYVNTDDTPRVALEKQAEKGCVVAIAILEGDHA